MPLDPQVKEFLDRLRAAQLPPIERQTVAEARAQMDLSTRFLGTPPPVGGVVDRRIPGPGGPLRIRVITPAEHSADGPAGAVLVYCHGGGWVLGSVDSHDSVCRALANASGVKVVSVDYRLAPEHRFPAAAEDAYAATAWIAENAGELGVDPSRIAVGGDSAGNLAAAATLMARDRGGPPIAFQVLIYPILDCDLGTGSYVELGRDHFLTRDEMEWYWTQYVEDRARRSDPLVSPCRALDLSGLPPALILTAEYDVLRDEGERYAALLAAAGVPVKLSRYDGMIHGFVRRYPFFDRGREAVAEIGREIRETLRN